MPSNQIRHAGAGRKDAIKTQGCIEAVFLKVIDGHIAGDPMNENIRWLKLTRAEISEKMREHGVKISRNIVRKLMKKHKLVKRKMRRKRPIGKSADRKEQFRNIVAEKEKFLPIRLSHNLI